MKTLALIGLLICLFLPRIGLAAGTTLISHGLNDDADGWVNAMAEKIVAQSFFPGTKHTIYQIGVTNVGAVIFATWRRTSGDLPLSTDSREILVKLDWRSLANNSTSTEQVAPWVFNALASTNFISELGGHALAEFPLHLIGHSRGGSLVCEVSRLLGNQGIWTDHLTTLDPHPMNNDGFIDFPFYTVVDAPARTYESVLFHDNYFQTLNLIAYGEAVAGAYVRQLSNLDGGYSSITASHSDAHLWYQGTIDRQYETSDGTASIGLLERQNWYSSFEQQGVYAGFYYSLIGRGDRQSSAQPVSSSAAQIKDGLNQLWDFGAGQNYNRTALTANSGTWPNVVKLNLTTTNLVAHGQSVSLKIFYHWATNIVRSGTIGFYSDDDLNPLNSNSRLIREFSFNSQGPNNMGISTTSLTIDSTNSPAGFHAVYAKITGGGRSRYLYAPEILNVVSSFAQPTLDVVRSGNQVSVGVNGVAGQIVILDSASSIGSWSPVATNRLSTNRWTVPYTLPAGSGSQFFRARLGP